MLISKKHLTIFLPFFITMPPYLAVGAEDIVEVGHHTVHYLGTTHSVTDDISTASWAITENGCADSSTLSAEPRVAGGNEKGNGKGKGGGKGGTNCNSMSHAAFSDFLCNSADLVWPDATGELLYETVTNEPECDEETGQYECQHTYYQPNYGPSRPDGPGDWIKFSNHTSDPQTEQLSAGSTHIFAISFDNFVGEEYFESEINVAIKIGKTVVIGVAPGPSCLPTSP